MKNRKDLVIEELEKTFNSIIHYDHEFVAITDYLNFCRKFKLNSLVKINLIGIKGDGRDGVDDFYNQCVKEIRRKIPGYIPPNRRYKPPHDYALPFDLRRLFYEDLSLQIEEVDKKKIQKGL